MLVRNLRGGITSGVESPRGETIEARIRRIVHNNEPVTDSAPIIYTERKDGVIGAYDIRADKFDEALDAMDMMTEKQRKNRQKRIEGWDSDKTRLPDGGENKGNGQSQANSADGK